MGTLTHLFRPIRIRTMEVKNRIVLSPAATNLASPAGGMTPALIHHYALRARGGVGLIITEDSTIGPDYLWRNLSLREDRLIPEWRRLAEAVHAFGARIAPQLIHPSFNARLARTGVQPAAASPIPSRIFREIPKELTIEEIEEIVVQLETPPGGRKKPVATPCSFTAHTATTCSPAFSHPSTTKEPIVTEGMPRAGGG